MFSLVVWSLNLLSLLHLSAGDPRLVCQETVVAQIGDNVVLPCHLEPEENIQHDTVVATKVDPDVFVYAHHNGRQLANDYEPYRHRTFLNTEELKNGVLNLKISSVRQSDNGKFRIYIHTWRITSLVNLVVGNPLLVCQETVEAQIGLDVTLPCHMEPKQSIEADEVECRRSNLDVLVYTHNVEHLANNTDQYRHRTSVNIEELKNGVLNLTISSVRKSDNGTFNIYIHTWRINSTVTLIVDVPGPGVLIFGAVSLVLYVIVLILVKHKLLWIHVFTSLLLHLVLLTVLSLLYFSDGCCPLDVIIGVASGVFVVFAVVTLGAVVSTLVKTRCDLACWSETMRRRRRRRMRMKVLASQHRAEDPPRAQT